MKVRDLDPTFLTVSEKDVLMRELVHLRTVAEGLLLETMAVSANVADDAACASVAGWLVRSAQVERGAAAAMQRVAEASVRWRRVREAMRDGALSPARAEVIVKALDALGAEVSTAVKDQAETHLVALAGEHDAKSLRRLGEHILEVVDPGSFEEREQERLEDELRKAREATRLSIRSRGDGTSRISGVVPDAAAARLRRFLQSFSSPRSATANSDADPSPYVDPVTGRRLTSDRILGEAFCAFLEAADPKRMPMHGGAATSIIITMDLDKLRAGVGLAVTGEGEHLTPGEVRRLACQANLIPAVLGGGSEVLDLGRAKRLFSPAQRKALAIRWQTCAIDGCTVPFEWCEIHHLDPWASGGRTDMANGIPLCPHDHHYVDDPRFELRSTHAGFQLHRRT